MKVTCTLVCKNVLSEQYQHPHTLPFYLHFLFYSIPQWLLLFSFHVTFCFAPKLKEYMTYTSVPYCIPFHTQKVQKAKEITNKALLQTFLFSFLTVSSIVILFNKKVRACHHPHSSHLTTPKLSSFSSSSSLPLIFTTCHCTMFAFFFSSLSLESSSSSLFSHYPSCSELFVRMRSFFLPFLIPIPIITLDYSKWPGFLVTYLLPIPISLEEQRKWQATCWMKRRATFSLLSFPTFEKKEWVININFIFQPLSLSLQFFLFLSIKEWGNRNSSNKTLCLFFSSVHWNIFVPRFPHSTSLLHTQKLFKVTRFTFTSFLLRYVYLY